MRKESILVFVLLTCALATVAGAAVVDFSVVWNKTYGKPGVNDSAYSIVQVPGERGYVFAGETGSFGAGETDAWVVDLSGSGAERWNRTYGDPGKDTARSVINTSDGNFLFAGTFTYVTEGNRRDTDILVVKFSPRGDIIWNETFGGPDVNATAYAVAEAADGGYVVVGATAFWGEPDTDALVIKLNRSGSEEWTRTFGESGLNDSAYAVVVTPSGEIGVTGSTESFEAFETDAFILKMNSSGNEIWNTTFGGPENDTARSIVLAPDGDFVFAGSYMSRDAANRTEDDALVVKMKPDGKIAWNWTYGNADRNESAESVIATRDDGYLFAGRSGKSPLDNDAWIVKLDSKGAVEGDLTIGGANPGDRAASVIQTAASEYVFAGTFNATKKGGMPETDAWVVKLATKPKTVTKPPSKPPKSPKVCPGQCPPPKPKPTIPPAPKTGCIGDFVWNDTNKNGIQDGGEPGVQGVTVTLLNAQQREVATKVTDPRGKYVFSNLQPGDYYVRFSLPKDHIFTLKDAGGNDAKDSDADQKTGMTAKITLKAGDRQCQWDAGLVKQAPSTRGAIGDLVWDDTNKNGIQDQGEPGVADVTVRLLYGNDNPVNDSAGNALETKTDANGNYFFRDLANDDYIVEFVAPEGATFTTRDAGDDTKDSDADPGTGRTGVITLMRNEMQDQWDAGLVKTAGQIAVTKKANGQNVRNPPGPTINVGDTVTWTYEVTNPGTGPLTNVRVTDDKVGPIAGPPTGDDGNGKLDPGETWTYTKDDTVRDTTGMPGGFYKNTVTVTADDQTTKQVTATDVSHYTSSPAEGGCACTVDFTFSISHRAPPAGAQNPDPLSLTIYHFQGSAPTSNCPAGVTPAKWEWDFGDGKGWQDLGQNPTHTFATARTYDVKLRVTLSNGVTCEVTKKVTVEALPQPEGKGSIGDFVWNDTNGDGIQSEGEGGIADATVELYYANETLANSTTTEADGAYLFTALPAGEYYLVFALPEGYNFTPANQGADDARDSDADPATGRTETITLADNDMQLDWDAGANLTAAEAAENATIGDFIWNDTNDNALQDEGEAGVSGVTVRLLDENGDQVTDAARTAVETMTGGDGRYALEGVVGTTYIIEVVAPAGLTFVTPDTGDDTRDSDVGVATGRTEPFVLAGDDLTRDAGLTATVAEVETATVAEVETATVGGIAWNDTNADGARDAGEAGVPRVAVTLLGADGTTAGTATADDTGAYQFTGVAVGTYSLSFTLPEGYTFGPAGQDSTVDPGSGTTEQFEIGPGEEQLTWNAGLVPPVVEETQTPEEEVTPQEETTPEEEVTPQEEMTTPERETGEGSIL